MAYTNPWNPASGVTGSQPTTGNPYYQGGQGPGYGRGLPGVRSGGTTGNQPVTGSQPVGGSGTQGGNGTVGSPWMNPGGNVGSPTAPPQSQPPMMTTMAMGEEGGGGGPTPIPGVPPQHPFGGLPIAPPPPQPPMQRPNPPAIPKNIAAGAEDDFRPSKQELKQMSPQERSAANRSAHNARAADNRHDVNARGALLRNAGNERRAENRSQPPQPPISPPPFPMPGQVPGTGGIGGINFAPPQMMIPPGAEVVGGGQGSQFTQALMRALGG
jgi:hypothetical protein